MSDNNKYFCVNFSEISIKNAQGSRTYIEVKNATVSRVPDPCFED